MRVGRVESGPRGGARIGFTALGMLTAAAVGVAAAAFAGRAQPARAGATAPATITVQGSAQVPVTDLVATFTVGVDHQASTASAALAGDDEVMQRVITALEAKGVPEKRIQTQNLSVNPVYSQSDTGPTNRIVGWDANDTLLVSTDPARVGTLIDAAMAAGANMLNSVSFGPANPSQVQQQAEAAAVVDARNQAQAVAAAGGLTLGPVTSISTQVQMPPQPLGLMASAAVAPRTPVLTGTQYASAQVTVTFAASAR